LEKSNNNYLKWATAGFGWFFDENHHHQFLLRLFEKQKRSKTDTCLILKLSSSFSKKLELTIL
jgi:hypothetical protein